MPETLIESFANLIKFYKVGEPNDDVDIMNFMKTASLKDILAKKEYWGEDLSYLYDEVSKYYED